MLRLPAGLDPAASPAPRLCPSPLAGRKQFARHEWAQKAAYLLGCSLEELSSSIFKHQPKGALQRSTSFRQRPEEASSGDGSGTVCRCRVWAWGVSGDSVSDRCMEPGFLLQTLCPPLQLPHP